MNKTETVLVLKNKDTDNYIKIDSTSGGYPYEEKDILKADRWKRDDTKGALRYKTACKGDWELIEATITISVTEKVIPEIDKEDLIDWVLNDPELISRYQSRNNLIAKKEVDISEEDLMEAGRTSNTRNINIKVIDNIIEKNRSTISWLQDRKGIQFKDRERIHTVKVFLLTKTDYLIEFIDNEIRNFNSMKIKRLLPNDIHAKSIRLAELIEQATRQCRNESND